MVMPETCSTLSTLGGNRAATSPIALPSCLGARLLRGDGGQAGGVVRKRAVLQFACPRARTRVLSKSSGAVRLSSWMATTPSCWSPRRRKPCSWKHPHDADARLHAGGAGAALDDPGRSLAASGPELPDVHAHPFRSAAEVLHGLLDLQRLRQRRATEGAAAAP
ncbi:unnamed protein product [Prorocentrum cordatum]|uniref:Uncharacterized protein n=1 Tax=Prorocentrum cordatum TaxID=2364126 RepID=A0ABN9RXD7_9DINO|nr:unnamed protein product [Polarella glacialis]